MTLKVRDKLCRWLCGRRFDDTHPSAESMEMPPEVREASHNLANAATQMQTLAHTIKRQADVFHDLVHTMRGQQ